MKISLQLKSWESMYKEVCCSKTRLWLGWEKEKAQCCLIFVWGWGKTWILHKMYNSPESWEAVISASSTSNFHHCWILAMLRTKAEQLNNKWQLCKAHPQGLKTTKPSPGPQFHVNQNFIKRCAGFNLWYFTFHMIRNIPHFSKWSQTVWQFGRFD